MNSDDEIAELASPINSMADGITRNMLTQSTILDNSVVGITKLVDQKFLWVSRYFEQIFGNSRDELIGRRSRFYTPTRRTVLVQHQRKGN